MTTVVLEGMKFYSYHGYYEKERQIGNHFILDVYARLPQFDSKEDDIGDTVNYEKIYATCEKYMKMQFKLLESIALHIATDLKSQFPQINHLKVRLTKLNPPLDGKVDKAIIEYEL